MKLIVQLVST